jgi:glutathione S-transferase
MVHPCQLLVCGQALTGTCGIARQVLDTALSGKEFLVDNKFSIADIASYCWVVSAPCVAALLMLWPISIYSPMSQLPGPAQLQPHLCTAAEPTQPTAFWRRWAIEGFEYDEFPNLKAWKERIDARPATQVHHLSGYCAAPCAACGRAARATGHVYDAMAAWRFSLLLSAC